MASNKIKFITNESGDWEIARYEDFEASGHRLTMWDYKELLEFLGYEVEVKEISDDEMERISWSNEILVSYGGKNMEGYYVESIDNIEIGMTIKSTFDNDLLKVKMVYELDKDSEATIETNRDGNITLSFNFDGLSFKPINSKSKMREEVIDEFAKRIFSTPAEIGDSNIEHLRNVVNKVVKDMKDNK